MNPNDEKANEIRKSIWLTVLGVVTATAAIITTSECTTTGATTRSTKGADPETGAWLTAPPTPQAIAAPNGATVAAHFKATGAQVYVCTATPSGPSGPGLVSASAGFAWTLQAPDAKLLDAAGVEVGTHGAGPSWKSLRDGSSVVGKKVAQADGTAPGAIPWLLLRTASTTPGGVFSPITFIQRVNTNGGKAPAVGCDASAAAVKATVRVDYGADYYFFTGGAAS